MNLTCYLNHYLNRYFARYVKHQLDEHRRTVTIALVSILTLVLSLGMTSSASAQSTDSWQASYWNNTSMAGQPILVRAETEINYDWDDNSPAPGLVSSDRFSARWTRDLNLPAGRYRFTVTGDDGVRLWVNNELLIDEWTIQSANTFRGEIQLPGGIVPVRLDYFENTADATVRLDWQRVERAPQAGSWLGEYFNNTSLSGTPSYVARTEQISFNWGIDSPEPNFISSQGFSARWTRTLNLTPGEYRFTAIADDGVRIWVDNQLIMDEWRVQPETKFERTIYIRGGDIPIRVEYFEDIGGASVFVDWTPVSTGTPGQPALAPPPSSPPANIPPEIGAPLNTWRGEYFNTVDMSGSPSVVRFDPNLNFDWRTGSPAPGQIGADRFSVRWTRTLSLEGGQYRFIARSDDGVRLWVNGNLVIDQWDVRSVQSYSALVNVEGGAIPVRMEYFENTGEATASLTWSRVESTEPPLAPPATDMTGVVARASYLNMRSGPSTVYPSIGVLAHGDNVRMIARNATATWIQVVAPDGRIAWVYSYYLNSNTPLTSLPIR